MKICIIAEGSYPYITGGVSSWIHSLISSIPEHDFIVYTIGAQQKMRGKFKYTLPPNVIEIHETFLDSHFVEKESWGKRYKLTQEERDALKDLLGGEKVDWEKLFTLFQSNKIDSVTNFITSKDFFDILIEICVETYVYVPFNDMFWTLRSMVLPLFISMMNQLPKADLYHSVSTGYAGVIASLASHKYKVPFILTEHGIYSREREDEIIKSDWVKGHFKDLWIQYFHKMSHCAYHFAEQVITLFTRNKEIQIEIGCDEGKISLIPNGVSLDEWGSKYTEAESLHKRHINIGAIVRVVPIKDIKTMIQSFAIVKNEIPNVHFHIMGPTQDDEEYFEECNSLIQSLNVQDIVFTGTVNVKDYVQQMDLLVLSSISEGQPLAILEGFASAKPFVSTNVGSCKELIYGHKDTFGEAGIIVPVMDYRKMAEAIIILATNEELRKKMGLAGYNRVSTLYTKDRFIDGYRRLYTQVVNK